MKPGRLEILDIDDTFCAAHGAQELAFWNAHHDERGFASMHNRLDAFVYATYDHAPARLPRATTGNNRQLAPVLGYPALAVPGGFSSNGLPLGFEFLGLPFAEGTLFKAAVLSQRRRTDHACEEGSAPS